MKKILSICLTFLFLIIFCMPVFAASVTPQRFDGNDANTYVPPSGCIHYVIPNSGTAGTYTVKFNDAGQVDANGNLMFTVTVGTAPGNTYTEVLSWSSNFPIYAVIVKGGDAYNLYQYPTSTRSDTNLVSPDNPSGGPADVSHVSVVFCPSGSSSSSSSCSSCGTSSTLCGIVIVSLIVAFFLIGIISGVVFFCCKNGNNR